MSISFFLVAGLTVFMTVKYQFYKVTLPKIFINYFVTDLFVGK